MSLSLDCQALEPGSERTGYLANLAWTETMLQLALQCTVERREASFNINSVNQIEYRYKSKVGSEVGRLGVEIASVLRRTGCTGPPPSSMGPLTPGGLTAGRGHAVALSG